MSCICGNDLVPTRPQIYGSYSVVFCNKCLMTISSTDIVYHCSRMSITSHPNGYDICTECCKNQAIETKETSSFCNSKIDIDINSLDQSIMLS